MEFCYSLPCLINKVRNMIIDIIFLLYMAYVAIYLVWPDIYDPKYILCIILPN